MKKLIKIFLELGPYLFALMLMSGLLISISFVFSKNLALFQGYNTFALSLDIFKTWSAIYVILPWFTKQEDFLPEAEHKFVAMFYMIIFLHNCWITGPWGLC